MKTFNFEGDIYTLEEMLDANPEDADVCEWLNTCEVGDSWDWIVKVTRLT